MIKTIRVMLKPNNKQNSLLFQCAGTSRFAYNWVLKTQKENRENGGSFLSDMDLRKKLTQLKKTEEFKWLFKYSNNITKQAVKDACGSYKRFFKKQSKFPKFKTRKHSKPSFYHDNVKLKVAEKHVILEKLGKVKLAEFNRITLGVKYFNPRISFDGLRWFITVGVEFEEKEVVSSNSEGIGIDLGIKEFAVVSNGKRYININKTHKVRKITKKLKRLQRKASKRYLEIRNKKIRKGNNLLKLETKIKKTHQRLTNIRENHIHQITAELAKTKPAYVVMEDLNIKGMLKNKHLSKAVMEQGFRKILTAMEYKCLWNGIRFVKADRFFPSSKMCSACGIIKKDLKLSDRTFTCECGNKIDRDLQAAINLRNYVKLTS